MRIAFTLIGGAKWTGGVNYLTNLLSALSELPNRPVEAVLFTGLDTDAKTLDLLRPYLAEPPIKSELWTKGTMKNRLRLLKGLILQRDSWAEQIFLQAGINLIFQHSDWYGCRFTLPTLAWIPDFQHRYLPNMFSTINYWRRELFFHALTQCATKILVSSEDARQDCEQFCPTAKGNIAVLPFAVKIEAKMLEQRPEIIRQKYHLPEKFLFLPNQFWKHKNHLGIIESLKLLKLRGEQITIAVSGNPQDSRHPNHPEQIFAKVREYQLENEFRWLGMIPYIDIFPLMRASVAVINPSFFEGWSTTVEEAKSLGVPLLLSNLRVHREQTPTVCRFFNPSNPQNMAEVISLAWNEWEPGPRSEQEAVAEGKVKEWRTEFAQRFVNIAKETIENKKE